MAEKTCVRPLPMTGTRNLKVLRKNDYVRCLCGQDSCRDKADKAA
jgi:hypothetical protein